MRSGASRPLAQSLPNLTTFISPPMDASPGNRSENIEQLGEKIDTLRRVIVNSDQFPKDSMSKFCDKAIKMNLLEGTVLKLLLQMIEQLYATRKDQALTIIADKLIENEQCGAAASITPLFEESEHLSKVLGRLLEVNQLSEALEVAHYLQVRDEPKRYYLALQQLCPALTQAGRKSEAILQAQTLPTEECDILLRQIAEIDAQE